MTKISLLFAVTLAACGTEPRSSNLDDQSDIAQEVMTRLDSGQYAIYFPTLRRLYAADSSGTIITCLSVSNKLFMVIKHRIFHAAISDSFNGIFNGIDAVINVSAEKLPSRLLGEINASLNTDCEIGG
jgi:hypothetical protein